MGAPDGYMMQKCYHCGNEGFLKIEKSYAKSYGGFACDDFCRVIDMDLNEDFAWYLLSCPVCERVTLFETYTNECYENPYTDGQSVETIRCRLCDEYERQYREIQQNQSRYVENANGRLPMLIADKKDTDSTINRLVLAINECNDEVYDEVYDDPMTSIEWLKGLHQLLAAPRADELGELSIYKPRTPPREDLGFMKPLPPKEKKELHCIDVVGCIPKYSAKTVNRRLDVYMAGKDLLSVTELPLSTHDDFYELVSMVLFSDDPDCNYQAEMQSGHFEKDGFTASNFIVKRKVNKRKEGDLHGV